MSLPSKYLNKHILIVDDAASQRNLTKAVLRDIGFLKTQDASNGDEALKLIEKNQFDLVICDWDMSKMDGLELFKSMKDDSKINTIPFILLTGTSKSEKVKEALAAGISHYIVKPYTAEVLLNKVKNIFKLI